MKKLLKYFDAWLIVPIIIGILFWWFILDPLVSRSLPKISAQNLTVKDSPLTQTGRYQVVTGKATDGPNYVILLDTATGEMWGKRIDHFYDNKWIKVEKK